MDIILDTGNTLQSHFKLSISRANKEQRMKNITIYGHKIRDRKHTLQSHFKLSISIG